MTPAANDNPDRKHDVAAVDQLVDENGSPIEVPHDSELKVAADNEPTVGATGPTNWWRLGLLALAVVIIILGVLQVLNSGREGNANAPAAASAPVAP